MASCAIDAGDADLELPRDSRPAISVSLLAAPPQIFVAILKLVAAVLRQILPAVPFLAQMLLVLRRKILPITIVSLDVLALLGAQVSPALFVSERPA